MMKKSRSYLLVIAPFLAALAIESCAEAASPPTVTIKVDGNKSVTFEGEFTTNVRGEAVDVFHGIPYAEEPQRWRDAEPKVWKDGETVSETRNASHVKPCMQLSHTPEKCSRPGCMQLGGQFVVGENDCLRLSVWKPSQSGDNATSTAKLPVMVWIHGGGLTNGAIVDLRGNNMIDGEGLLFVAVQCKTSISLFCEAL